MAPVHGHLERLRTAMTTGPSSKLCLYPLETAAGLNLIPEQGRA